MTVDIINDSDVEVSAHLYNSDDGLRWSANWWGDLKAKGDSKKIDLSKYPSPTGRYHVLFTRKGFTPLTSTVIDKLVGPEAFKQFGKSIDKKIALAAGEVAENGWIRLEGSDPDFTSRNNEMYPATSTGYQPG